MPNKRPALVLAFSKPKQEKTPLTDFCRALAAITILDEKNMNDGFILLDQWVDAGLLSEEERISIYHFYKVIS